MVPVDAGRYHGKCYATAKGRAAFLALPDTVLDTLRLDDIGSRLMRAVMEKRA